MRTSSLRDLSSPPTNVRSLWGDFRGDIMLENTESRKAKRRTSPERQPAVQDRETRESGRDYRFWRSQSVKAMADLDRARGDEIGRILNAHTKKYGSLRAFINNRMIDRYLHNNELAIEEEAKKQKALNVVALIKEKRMAEHNLDARRAATEESLRHMSKMNKVTPVSEAMGQILCQAYFAHQQKPFGGRQANRDGCEKARAVDRASSLLNADLLRKGCIPRPRTSLTLTRSGSSDCEAANLHVIYERTPSYENDPDAAINNALKEYRPMTVGVIADAEKALSRSRGFRGAVERFLTASEAKLQSRSAKTPNPSSPLRRSLSVTTRKTSLPAPFTTDMLLRPLLYDSNKKKNYNIRGTPQHAPLLRDDLQGQLVGAI